MKALLIGFIAYCDKLGITPYEKHIDIYLRSVKDLKYDIDEVRNYFIHFCFYHWERRNVEGFLSFILGFK